MKRALFALLLAASVVAVAQDPKTAAKPAPAAPAKPAAVPAPAKPAAAPAPAKPAAAPAKAAPAASGIVANKDSKTFHKADCPHAAKIKEANKTSFASSAEAVKAGYKACKTCKP